MPTLHTLMVFAGIALLFAASPGPNFIYVLSRSIGHGRREGLFSTLGIGTGAIVHTAAAVLGISALLTTSAIAFSLVKYAGATYLIYLGIKTLVNRNRTVSLESTRPGEFRAYREGLITMLLNPKAALYYFSFLPQFVDPSLGHASLQLTMFGLMQALAGLIVYTLIVLLAGSVGERIRKRRKLRQAQQWATGCTYLALGATVTLSRR